MRIGILGAARIAPHVVVGPAARSGFASIVAAAARDVARARVFAQQHAIADVEPNYRSLLARDDLDLVYVALPNSAHADWSRLASAHGHAVLCEKPMATSVADVTAMVDAGAAAGKPVIEAFHYRHHPLMHAVVEMVRSGQIGEIVDAEASFIADLPRSDPVRWDASLGGGALFDLGCYAVHALRSIIGAKPVIERAAAEWVDGVDAWLTGELVFEAGVTARIACSMVAGHRAANLRICGSAGEIMVENFVAPQLPHRMLVRDAKGEREFRFEGPGTFDCQFTHVHDVLSGKVRPLTGGTDAIANMMAIEALYAAARDCGRRSNAHRRGR
jgi:predicted dehydrogenase